MKNDELHKGASSNLFKFAKVLRQSETESEKILWKSLRNRKLNNLKFRRQHPIKNFIADFYCYEAALVVEIDGKIHEVNDQKEYDLGRSYELKELEITVIRFTNQEVKNELEKILIKISDFCKNTPQP